MAKRVLIVDDHAPTRSLVKAMIEADRADNFEVVEAEDGAGCVMTVERNGPFDLILLDVDMPDMDGYETCRALRTASVDTPVIFVTAKGALKDFHAGREAGGDSYLKKPVSRQALRSIVALFTSVDRKKE